MSDLTRNAIAQLREQLDQERTRAEAAEAELREERMKRGALVTVAKLLSSYSRDLGDCDRVMGQFARVRVCDMDRLRELLADEGGEWVEKAHCDTIEGELRDLRQILNQATKLLEECEPMLMHGPVNPREAGAMSARIGIWRRSHA